MDLKWNKTRSLTLSRILTIVVIVLGIGALFCIPVIAEWYDAVSGKEPIRMQLTAGMYLSDFLALIALWALMRMLSNIAAQRIFEHANEQCMRLISWCCFGVTGIWTVIGYWRPLAFLVAFIALFA